MGVLRSILNLPSYMWGVGVLFWCFQLGSLTGFIKWWRLGAGRKNDLEGVLRFLKWAFRYRVVRLDQQDVYKGGKCMYLANHRGWADFFVDMYIIGARALPLSRRAVGMAFPAFTSSLLAVRGILLFNRAGVRDTDKFNSWLDAELERGPVNCLLVYPEGTRSQQQRSLPLKRGMLRYAFTRRLPVQVVATAYKEEVLNERRRWMHFGRTLVTGCSDVVESSRFEDFEEFMAAVQQLWDTQWEKVHSAPREGLVEHEPAFPVARYSAGTVVKQMAALAFWTAAMLGLGWAGLRALAALAARSIVGRYAVAGLALYWAASMAAAALLPPPPPRITTRGAAAAASDAVGKKQQ